MIFRGIGNALAFQGFFLYCILFIYFIFDIPCWVLKKILRVDVKILEII